MVQPTARRAATTDATIATAAMGVPEATCASSPASARSASVTSLEPTSDGSAAAEDGGAKGGVYACTTIDGSSTEATGTPRREDASDGVLSLLASTALAVAAAVGVL